MPRLDLNPQRAAVLNRLLDQALDLAPAGRAQWLADLPEEFAALKPHLQDLLSRAPIELRWAGRIWMHRTELSSEVMTTLDGPMPDRKSKSQARPRRTLPP
jgi:hypothetical protein